MDKTIEKFITGRSFAIAGVSKDPRKFGNAIVKELVQRGFTIYPVHPSLERVEGVKCYSSLDLVAGFTRSLIVCVKPENAIRVVKEAAVCGFNLVWLQQGCGADKVVEAAKGAGLEVVSGKCILMYTEPVGGFHKFHRGVNKLFGKY